MGCTASKNIIASPDDQEFETRMNVSIENEQVKMQRELADKIHLMIIGTGDSGKTSKWILHIRLNMTK